MSRKESLRANGRGEYEWGKAKLVQSKVREFKIQLQRREEVKEKVDLELKRKGIQDTEANSRSWSTGNHFDCRCRVGHITPLEITSDVQMFVYKQIAITVISMLSLQQLIIIQTQTPTSGYETLPLR